MGAIYYMCYLLQIACELHLPYLLFSVDSMGAIYHICYIQQIASQLHLPYLLSSVDSMEAIYHMCYLLQIACQLYLSCLLSSVDSMGAIISHVLSSVDSMPVIHICLVCYLQQIAWELYITCAIFCRQHASYTYLPCLLSSVDSMGAIYHMCYLLQIACQLYIFALFAIFSRQHGCYISHVLSSIDSMSVIFALIAIFSRWHVRYNCIVCYLQQIAWELYFMCYLWQQACGTCVFHAIFSRKQSMWLSVASMQQLLSLALFSRKHIQQIAYGVHGLMFTISPKHSGNIQPIQAPILQVKVSSLSLQLKKHTAPDLVHYFGRQFILLSTNYLIAIHEKIVFPETTVLLFP